MSKGSVLRLLRKTHLYLGIFTAPSLLFFAFTGAMQTFSLHETTPGSNYKPPAWIMTLAQIHKKQTDVVPVRKAPKEQGPKDQATKGQEAKESGSDKSATEGKAAIPAQPPSPPQKSHLPLKIFFLLVAVSLVLSTLTGIYMAYKYERGWLLISGLLVAGLVMPILLLKI